MHESEKWKWSLNQIISFWKQKYLAELQKLLNIELVEEMAGDSGKCKYNYIFMIY